MPRTVRSSGSRNHPGRLKICTRVSTVASSAASIASKARAARPLVRSASRLQASTSTASMGCPGRSPKNRCRSPVSLGVCPVSGGHSSSPRSCATWRCAASRAPPLVPGNSQLTRSTRKSLGSEGRVPGLMTTTCLPARRRSYTAVQISCVIVRYLSMGTCPARPLAEILSSCLQYKYCISERGEADIPALLIPFSRPALPPP